MRMRLWVSYVLIAFAFGESADAAPACDHARILAPIEVLFQGVRQS